MGNDPRPRLPSILSGRLASHEWVSLSELAATAQGFISPHAAYRAAIHRRKNIGDMSDVIALGTRITVRMALNVFDLEKRCVDGELWYRSPERIRVCGICGMEYSVVLWRRERKTTGCSISCAKRSGA